MNNGILTHLQILMRLKMRSSKISFSKTTSFNFSKIEECSNPDSISEKLSPQKILQEQEYFKK
jgi:hypothetical protein